MSYGWSFKKGSHLIFLPEYVEKAENGEEKDILWKIKQHIVGGTGDVDHRFFHPTSSWRFTSLARTSQQNLNKGVVPSGGEK